jgi:hypothetical protein
MAMLQYDACFAGKAACWQGLPGGCCRAAQICYNQGSGGCATQPLELELFAIDSITHPEKRVTKT